jgi:hypothetical protein
VGGGEEGGFSGKKTPAENMSEPRNGGGGGAAKENLLWICMGGLFGRWGMGAVLGRAMGSCGACLHEGLLGTDLLAGHLEYMKRKTGIFYFWGGGSEGAILEGI